MKTLMMIYLFPLKVLGKCQLREVVQEKEGGLDSQGEILIIIGIMKHALFSIFLGLLIND